MLRPTKRINFFIQLLGCLLMAGAIFGQSKPSAELDMARCWSFPLSEAATRITSDGTHVFIGLSGGAMEAISGDGKKVWSSEFGGEITSNILTVDSTLYFVTSQLASGMNDEHQARLRAVSKETGITLWTGFAGTSGPYYLYSSNGSLVLISHSGSVQLVDNKNGSPVWKRDLPEPLVTDPVFTKDSVVVATRGNQIITIAANSGKIESTTKVADPVSAMAIVADGLIVGDERGNVTLIDNYSGRSKWKFRSGGEISSIIPDGEHILSASHDNFIYFLNSRRGGMSWKRRLTGRGQYIGAYSDGYVFASSLDVHSLVFIHIASGKLGGQIVLADDEFLAASPATAKGVIYLSTGNYLYAYSAAPCVIIKNEGADK